MPRPVRSAVALGLTVAAAVAFVACGSSGKADTTTATVPIATTTTAPGTDISADTTAVTSAAPPVATSTTLFYITVPAATAPSSTFPPATVPLPTAVPTLPPTTTSPDGSVTTLLSSDGGDGGVPNPTSSGRYVTNPADNVKLDDYGPAVNQIQQRLLANGLTGFAVDGDYGPTTKTAVMRFQTIAGLASDGVCGRNTWQALNTNPPVGG